VVFLQWKELVMMYYGFPGESQFPLEHSLPGMRSLVDDMTSFRNSLDKLNNNSNMSKPTASLLLEQKYPEKSQEELT
jgi:hypothetical protein